MFFFFVEKSFKSLLILSLIFNNIDFLLCFRLVQISIQAMTLSGYSAFCVVSV